MTRSRKTQMNQWLEEISQSNITKLSGASFNNFTYHGEDGIILYLLSKLGNVPPVFVDIGSGDCITGNCANLAVHFGWDGIFIDKNEQQLQTGKRFYQSFISRRQNIRIVNELVLTENVNRLISQSVITGEIGLLSIDIDGNDYWIWKAIDIIAPRIVVIEAKVEFGKRNVIVPYGGHNHHSIDKIYNGASLEAYKRLGEKKGYKLVGANKQGYNLFFVKKGEQLKEETVEEILSDPETINSFYPDSLFLKYKFVTE